MSTKFDFKTLGQPFEADWPVTVMEPQDGGTVVAKEFMARFRLLGGDEIKQVMEVAEDDAAYIRKFFVGLAKSEGVELTEEVLELMLNRPFVRKALFEAWQKFQRGVAAKN